MLGLINKFIENPSATVGTVLGLLIFSAGAITDILRSILIDPLLGMYLEWKAGDEYKLPEDYLSRVNKDNLEVFTTLVDRTHVYYRLAANGCLALIFILGSIIYMHSFKEWLLEICIGILVLLFLVAAYHTKKHSNWTMVQFYKSERGPCA